MTTGGPEMETPSQARPTIGQGAALGETVNAALDRAGVLPKDATEKARDGLADYLDGGLEQLSEDLVNYVRSQPITALIVAIGVGVFVGMLLSRRAEGR